MKLLIFFLILAASTGSSFAERKVKYRLTAFGVGGNTGINLVNSKTTGDTALVSQGYVNDPIVANLRDNAFLDFYDSKKVSDEDLPLFSLSIPANSSNQLLILLTLNGDDIKPQLIDMREQKLKLGEDLYFNNLGVPIKLRFAGRDNKKKWSSPIIINAGKSKRITPPKKGAFYKEISARNRRTSKYQPFANSIDVASKIGPRLVFCYLKKGAKRPSMSEVTIHKVVEPAVPN